MLITEHEETEILRHARLGLMRHSGLMALAFAGFLQCFGGAMSAGGVRLLAMRRS